MSDAILRLRRIARPMSFLVTAAMVLIPLGLLVALTTGSFDEAYVRAEFSGITLPDQISTLAWVTIYGLGILSVGLVLLALWHMRTLFALYAMGDVFGPDTARAIRRIGLTLLVLAAFGVLGHTLSILALTSTNPPGQRALSIGFSSSDIFLFFTAGLLVTIGWAMSEAVRIADENRAFI